MRRVGALSIGLVNGAGLLFILFFAHIAFAAGVATTVRAAIAAYLLAAIIGLIWVGLLQLHYTARTSIIFALATLGLTLVAAWFLLQPRTAYGLRGGSTARSRSSATRRPASKARCASANIRARPVKRRRCEPSLARRRQSRRWKRTR